MTRSNNRIGWDGESEGAQRFSAPPPPPLSIFISLGVLLALLAFAFSFTFKPEHGTVSNSKMARSQIGAFEQQLRLFHLDLGQYPNWQQGLQALQALPAGVANPGGWRGPYSEKEIPADPWGNPYRYNLLNGAPWILSAGPDGEFLTEDDISNRDELPRPIGQQWVPGTD